MESFRVHSLRFYDIEPKAIHCMNYESETKRLALSRSDHSIEIWSLSFIPYIERVIPGSPDLSVEGLVWCNKRLFSAGLHGMIVEHDLLSLSTKACYPVTSGPAWCLAINSQKTDLASGTEDGYICTFEITPTGLLYGRVLEKQEGRILCVAWHSSGKFIVSGSADTIRVWNVETGHVVARMTTGRTEANKETLVWCLAVTDDFTIISGDSRGRTSFWDGNIGVLQESIHSHKADVLCLCLNPDQETVYSAGIDPTVVHFAKVSLYGTKSGEKKWVKSIHYVVHTHDIRSIVLVDQKLITGGVDAYLAVSSYPPKSIVKYPPLLQGSCVVIAPKARCVLLRYTTYLELWRLGRTEITSGSNGSKLPLAVEPVKLLQLKSKDDEEVVCSAVSGDSQWISYSSQTTLRLYHFSLESGQPGLQRVRDIPDESLPAHRMIFTPDSTRLVTATSNGSVQVYKVEIMPMLLHTFQPGEESGLEDCIHLLTVTSDGKYAVVGDHQSNIVVLNVKDMKVQCKLPRHKYQPTALGVHPETHDIVVTYEDHKIVEYSIKANEYTSFSRELAHHLPKHWLSRSSIVSHITFALRNKHIIILQDDNTICVIDKKKKFLKPRTKQLCTDSRLLDKLHGKVNTSVDNLEERFSISEDTQDGSVSRSAGGQVSLEMFRLCKKYKHLVYFGYVENDEMLAVEVSPERLAAKLPPTLKQKKYGV